MTGPDLARALEDVDDALTAIRIEAAAISPLSTDWPHAVAIHGLALDATAAVTRARALLPPRD